MAASLGWGMERRQGSELRQLALVQFVSILYDVHKEKKVGEKRGRNSKYLKRKHGDILWRAAKSSQRAGGGDTVVPAGQSSDCGHIC